MLDFQITKFNLCNNKKSPRSMFNEYVSWEHVLLTFTLFKV